MSRAAERDAESVESHVREGKSGAAGARPQGARTGGAVTQLKALGYGAGATAVRPGADDATARQGIRGGGAELPHRAVAEAALGVDARAVRAHTGPDAKAACEALGAEAYAYGSDIAFSGTPTAALVAHELTHVVQQQTGQGPEIQKKSGNNFGNPDPKNQISTLHPLMQAKAWEVINNAHNLGLNVWIVEGYRSIEKQNELYAQGRTKPGPIVTWAKGGSSYHNYGLAIDVVFHGSQPWGNQHNWQALGQAGQAAGLKWLGSIGDYPHFQIQGVTIAQLKAWHSQGGMTNVWQQVSANLGGGAAPAPSANPEPNAPAPTVAGGTYVVKKGDTLSGIAAKTLGSANKWQLIAQANNISDPNKIYPGQTLVIPGTAPNAPAPSGGGGGGGSAPAPAAPSNTATYVVKKGDSLSAIASKTLGNANKWPLIAQANGLESPYLIHPGQTLKIPGGTGAAAPAPSAPAPVAPAPTPPAAAPATYVVEKGDTLSGIAAKTLGSANKWQAIAQANNINDPNKIFPGQVLVIPGGQSSEAPAPPAPSTPAPTPQGPTTYVVQKGDSLSGIAAKVWGNGSKWQELATINNLKPPYTIYPGQVLALVAGAVAPAPTTPGPQPTPAPAGPQGPDKNIDPTMQPSDPISLQGLGGINLAMAKIYNQRGKYLKQVANSMGIDAASCAAVLQVEAGGQGFSSATEKMIVRFENHIFWNYWGKQNPQLFNEHFQFSQGETWKGHKWRPDGNSAWQTFHGDQTAEWKVLDFARGLSDTSALLSISMGAAQVMGFNHAKVGYGTVQEMFNAMAGGIKPQLEGMFTFIQKTPLCINGLKEGDFVKFSTGYNGAGKAQEYAGILLGARSSYINVTAGKQFA